jgi:hypothetical protein
MEATEKLSQMMIRNGLATGHGDTIDDLIFELEKQIKNTSAAFSDERKEIEQLRKAMDVQGNAVKVLHQAETSELNCLRKTAQEAYTAKMTLDSEREANKILTDEIERSRSIIKKADAILAEKDDHWSERIEGARNALFEGLEETR